MESYAIFALVYVCGAITGGLVMAVLADELVSRERERYWRDPDNWMP